MALFQKNKYGPRDAYAEVDPSRLTLRDYLAVDRTILANQNTFLAYIRTALTLFVVGLTFVKFFDQPVIAIIGWAFVPIGVVTFVVGFLRYNKLRVSLNRSVGPMRREQDQAGQPPA